MSYKKKLKRLQNAPRRSSVNSHLLVETSLLGYSTMISLVRNNKISLSIFQENRQENLIGFGRTLNVHAVAPGVVNPGEFHKTLYLKKQKAYLMNHHTIYYIVEYIN